MRALIPLLAAAIALPGCGGADEPSAETQVRDTLRSFATAVEDRDYQKLCDDIFSPDLLKSAQSIGLPCEVAMRTGFGELQDPKLTVGAVTVDGKTAAAEIKTSATGQPPSTDTIQLERLKGRWRVSGLGSGGAGVADAVCGSDEAP